MDEDFHLRADLRGHEEDVRAVSCCDLGVLTASRDKTIRLWAEDGGEDHGFHMVSTLVGHTDFVTCVLYIPSGASSDYPNGAIVSGSRDTTVRVWDPATCACTATLPGHTYQVTCLGLMPTGDIISGSLDKTLRVWRDGKCASTLTGHEGPVLCLLVLPGGEVLSGSGDTTVRMWAGATCIHTIQAHTDTVRGICVLPDVGFVTGSHDMTCKVWDSTGNVLSELVGHTALVYSVAASADGRFIASGSEDNTARVWRPSGECLQVIPHPGNIWAVTFMPACGDLLTACSDAVARAWTQVPARHGPAELVASLHSVMEQLAAAREASAKGSGGAAGAAGADGGAAAAGLPPGLKVEEPFALSQPGTKDGENKFVREPGSGDIVAYAWDSKGFTWEKIGTVVEGPPGGTGGGGGGAGGTKKFWAGQEWDFVFDVDVAEGEPPKKLALNAGDNPYIVADRFIEQEGLPAYFKEQIVQFITTSTAGAAKGPSLADMPVTGGFCDPFTGGAATSTGNVGSAAPRPGGGPSVPLSSLPITGGGVDPFTGGAAPATASASVRPGPPSHVPCHTYLAFDTAPSLEALTRKLREHNAAVASAAGGQQALTDDEVAAAGPLDSLLSKLPAAASGGGAAGITAADVELAARLLSWPAPQLFPALDVARLLVLDPEGARLMAAAAAAGDMAAPQPGTLAGGLSTAATSQLPANQQLALRLAANCFRHAPTRGWLLSGAGNLQQLLDAFASCASSSGGNKAVRLSLATFLGNVAAAAGLKQLHAGQQDVPLQALSCAIELLGSCPALEEPDAAFRCMVAIGTLLAAGGKDLAEVGVDLGVKERLRAVMEAAQGGGANEKRLLEVAIDVMAVLPRATK